jgi:hypothetical protein
MTLREDATMRQEEKEGRHGYNKLVSVLRPADFSTRQTDEQRGETSLVMKSSSIYSISA